MGPDPAFLQVLEQEQLFHRQQHKIIQAPADEIPVGAVPDAGQQLDDEQVEDLALEAPAVAAQGDIDVLPEPAGQRHVPAPPELGDGSRDIRVVEVLGELEAHHLAHADGHHGIARKVEVQLEAVGQDAQPHQPGGGVCQPHKGDGSIVRHPDDVGPEGAHRVGQQHFFGQAEGEDGHALLDLGDVVAVLVDVQLGRHVTVFDDGAGDQLREHDHIGPEVDDVLFRRHIAAVDVDGVGKGLEGVKADAQRQDADPLNGRKARPQQSVGALQDKICVLEIEQHPQAAHQGQPQKQPAQPRPALKMGDGQAAQVVDEDEGQHHREKPDLAPAVEHQAADEQDGVLCFGRGDIIGRQGEGQKVEQEDDRAEDQGGISFRVGKSKKEPMPQGTGSEGDRYWGAYSFITSSTAWDRSPLLSLEAMTITTRPSRPEIMAFSTLDWAWPNSA